MEQTLKSQLKKQYIILIILGSIGIAVLGILEHTFILGYLLGASNVGIFIFFTYIAFLGLNTQGSGAIFTKLNMLPKLFVIILSTIICISLPHIFNIIGFLIGLLLTPLTYYTLAVYRALGRRN